MYTSVLFSCEFGQLSGPFNFLISNYLHMLIENSLLFFILFLTNDSLSLSLSLSRCKAGNPRQAIPKRT